MRTFAAGLGAEVGGVAQGQVDDATLAGGHGSEFIRRTGTANLFSSNSGGCAQFVQTKRAEVATVEDDQVVLVAAQMQHFQGEIFEGAKQFAAALEQKIAVGAGQFDEDLRALP